MKDKELRKALRYKEFTTRDIYLDEMAMNTNDIKDLKNLYQKMEKMEKMVNLLVKIELMEK